MKNLSATVTPGLLAILLCAGCLGAEEATDDPTLDQDEAGAPPVLPRPSVWRVAPAPMPADARRRQLEVDHYIRDQLYRGYDIAETTQTYSGDLIDWVAPASVPGSEIEPPPPVPADQLATPPGVELQPTELDEHPELRGPDGTIPMVRPDFSRYVRGDSSAASLDDFRAQQLAGGQPWNRYRLYTGYAQLAYNTGVSSYVDQAIGAVEDGTFSLIETGTGCPGWNPPTTQELVGAVVMRDLAGLSSSTLRMRVEFLTAGDNIDDYIGGWDGQVSGFVPAAGRPYGPNIALAASVPGGAQYESAFRIENYYGNWWVAHNGNWLGYYPGYLFDLMHYQGCNALWYGEVFDPTPTDWTWTDMGSGYWSSYGFKWAAHVRNPVYLYGASAYYPPAPSAMTPKVNACYSNTAIQIGAAPWNRYFYLGGPGGNAIGCD